MLHFISRGQAPEFWGLAGRQQSQHCMSLSQIFLISRSVGVRWKGRKSSDKKWARGMESSSRVFRKSRVSQWNVQWEKLEKEKQLSLLETGGTEKRNERGKGALRLQHLCLQHLELTESIRKADLKQGFKALECKTGCCFSMKILSPGWLHLLLLIFRFYCCI